ncbi:DUF4369 domain-containing protein [Noviherbaspirillum sp.]|uniref:DUF4369 domain-containing protein n=1 Tax=Noviherbaspirillum sp. TaxID=1926288 RepID=UPI002B46DE2C|nr:DUF4369 domain-containing protein [Noviherbaspirillum sp.]HJV82343.1 DUF4369 domain-containing protein [Noviherbaspirillum sp.]
MKRSNLAAMLFCVVGVLPIAGCGGSSSPTDATIGGTVSGLPSGITVLLVNNNTETINVNTNGSFVFSRKVQARGTYNVTLYTQPTGASCAVANGTGTVNQVGENVANVSVTCTPAAHAFLNYSLGVTVSGLAQGNFVTFLNNGGDSVTANANGLFIFPKTYALQVAGDESYNVTVSTNPSGQTCTLSNASGTNTSANFVNFVNIVANCH